MLPSGCFPTLNLVPGGKRSTFVNLPRLSPTNFIKSLIPHFREFATNALTPLKNPSYDLPIALAAVKIVCLDCFVEIIGCITTAVVAYLLGSIPTGFLVAKARGVDIRSVGSGNIGATNVFRYLGKPAGIFVLFIDALKGWLAVVLVVSMVASGFHLPADSSTQ